MGEPHNYICGLEEHVHADGCYSQTIRTHDGECYTEESGCDLAEHIHESGCEPLEETTAEETTFEDITTGHEDDIPGMLGSLHMDLMDLDYGVQREEWTLETETYTEAFVAFVAFEDTSAPGFVFPDAGGAGTGIFAAAGLAIIFMASMFSAGTSIYTNKNKSKSKKESKTNMKTKTKNTKKKILTLALVILMTLALTANALAANITITGGKHGNIYHAFRLLDLTTTLNCTENHNPHGPECYGYSYTLNSKYKSIVLAALAIDLPNASAAELNEAVAQKIGAMDNDPTALRAFADTAYLLIQAGGIERDRVSNPEGRFMDVPQGYYLIVETGPAAVGDATSRFILNTMGQQHIDVATKKDVPTVEKEVEHHTGDDTWQKWTDVNIGDTVNYRVTGTLPSTLGDFGKYTYNLIDVMDSGLTYVQNSMVIEVNGIDVTDKFDIDFTSQTLKAECEDILDLNLPFVLDPTHEFVFTYSAKLNSNAVIGNPGNLNKVHLEYSSNPNPGGEGETATTPEDQTTVFTYKLMVTKTDKNNSNKKLQGADFVLYRMRGNTKEYAVVENDRVVLWTNNGGTTLKSNADGEIRVIGLDAGTYWLEETAAPTGYVQLTQPIEIVIAATIGESAGKWQIIDLTIAIDGGQATQGDAGAGIVTMTVENGTGTTFPGTGGIGNVVFVVAGAITAGFGIAVYAIYRKKASPECAKGKLSEGEARA